MTYYHIDYSQSSESPFGGPAKSAPFPGWGILPWAAGPRRIAIGASPDGLGAIVPQRAGTVAKVATPTLLATAPKLSTIVVPKLASDSTGAGGGGGLLTDADGEIPWWIYMAVPMAVGGIGLFAYDFFTRKKATPNRRRHHRTHSRS